MEEVASKEEYLAAFKAELELRGAGALSASAILRALDDADEAFETLQGRGKTPTSIAETLGSPKDRAEVVVARRLLRLQPGSSHGPRYVTYLRVIRALAIVSPMNLLVALVPAIVFVMIPFSFAVGSLVLVGMGLASGFAYVSHGAGPGLAIGFMTLVQFLGVVAGGIFLAFSSWDLVRGGEFVAWKWVRWNVDYLMREIV